MLRARGILLWAAQNRSRAPSDQGSETALYPAVALVEVVHVAVLVADDLDGDVTRVDERPARERPCACLISGQLENLGRETGEREALIPI